MGNQLAQPQKLQSDHLAELPNVVLKDSLGGGRFLKTALCVHDDGGLVVVKVYYKRDDSPDLNEYEQQLFRIRKRLSGQLSPGESHVWPFQRFIQTDKAVYLLRQHIFSNLHDRLSTRPFLSDMEKRWLVFQLLHSVAHSHTQGICHGDIKCENCLVTSWNWLFLTDFASYKPTLLPADNPANFSFFFDTGGRRRCYIAPERFYESSETNLVDPKEPLKQSMDVFSLGCCIAEVFLEGKALFDLSQLLAYRNSEYSPAGVLQGLDEDIREMVTHMIQHNPEDRLTAGAYLATWGTRIFPAYLSDAIHPFFHSLLPLDSDERVQVVSRSSSSLRNSILAIGRVQAGQSSREAQGHGKQQQQLAQDQAQQDGGQGNVGRAADNTTNPKDMEVPVGNGRLAPFDLLARVGALLTDTGDLESRLLSGDFGEDMVEMNSAEAEGDSQPHEGPGDGMDRESEGVMVVGEVAKDEFYEHQFRERDGEFRAALVDDIRLSGPGGGLPQKEDVQLPLEGGWEWAGEWVVQQYDVCDANGWMYRSGGTTTAEGPSSSSSMKGWSAACTADSLWRRRCWKRRRRRIAGVPSTSTGSAAQAGEESAGAATWRRPRRGPQEPVPEPEREQCEGMVLLTALLCTLLRGARYQDSKLTCLSLLCRTSALCDDDTRLQRAVPSLLAMVGDSCAMVRAGAVEALASILGLVENLPPSDAKIFPEYIFPGLSMLPSDPEELVRVAYASNLCKLATSASSFLTRAQAAQYDSGAPGSPSKAVVGFLYGSMAHDDAGQLLAYDAEVASIRDSVERVILELITGPRSTPSTKRALMPHMAGLARFLGRRRANDFLLPLLITCLNTKNWLLTGALFENIAGVGPYTGKHSLDVFLMPCLEQALKSEEEGIVYKALICLAQLVRCKQLQRRTVLKSAFQVAPHLCAASTSIRAAASSFIAAAAEVLPSADTYALMLPAVENATGKTPVSLADMGALVDCLPASTQRRLAGPPPDSVPFSAAGVENVVSGRSRRHGASATSGGTARSRPPLASRKQGAPQVADVSGVPVYTVRIKRSPQNQNDSLLDAVMETVADANRQQENDSPSRPNRGNISPTKDNRIGSTGRSLNLPGAESILPHAMRMAPIPPSDLSGSRLSPSTMVAATARLDERALSVYHLREDSAISREGGVAGAVAAALDQGLGPAGHSASGGVATHGISIMDSQWRPRGVLVAHLSEHRRAVNQLAVAPSQSYFVSASNDETVKIWDCRRLERDVSFRSRLTYANQGGKMLSVAFCEDGNSVASASSLGSLHIWRVEYSSRAQGIPDRYTGILSRRQMTSSEGALLEVMPMASNLLLYSTQRGGVHALDLRCWKDVWTLPLKGLLERMVADPAGCNWLLTGSSRGQLSVWDLRFRLCVQEWRHPLQQAVEAMALAVAPRPNLGLARLGVAFGTPLVYIAAGGDEIGLWDLEQGRCHQVLRVINSGEPESASNEVPAALGEVRDLPQGADTCTFAEHLRVQELKIPPPRSSGCRSVLPSAGGPVLTGGSDKCLRFWNARQPEASYIIAGPPSTDPSTSMGFAHASLNRQYIKRAFDDVDAIVEVPTRGASPVIDGQQRPQQAVQPDLNNQQCNSCHQDSILHMAYAEVHEKLLLSCSRDGTIKAWK